MADNKAEARSEFDAAFASIIGKVLQAMSDDEFAAYLNATVALLEARQNEFERRLALKSGAPLAAPGRA